MRNGHYSPRILLSDKLLIGYESFNLSIVVHPNTFHSILIHGHVMSREYMDQLAEPAFVAHTVLQHGRIQRIEVLKTRNYAEQAMDICHFAHSE